MLKQAPVYILASAFLCVAALADAQTRADTGVDASVHPGDDFFAYANGSWLKATEIPAGTTRWNARHEIRDLTARQVAQLIENAATAPAGSDARKVADFRAAYLNEAAIEAQGFTPLKAMFDRIAAVHDKAALTRLLGSELRADVDPLNLGVYESAHLLGLSVTCGNHGEKSYVAFLLQGGLGLAEREQYLDTSPDAQALRARYLARITHVLELAGFDRAGPRAEGVLALETAIAASHATREASSDERNADNLWTRADFARRAPGMDWTAFFAAAGLSMQDTFVVWQPTAIEGAAKLVASQPLPVWQDYLRFRTLDLYADVLPRGFAATPPVAAPRAQRALEMTQQVMSGPLGRVYSEQHFPAQQKARVRTITNNVIAAFRQRVSGVSWLSPASKTEALAKLATVYFGVGYPEKWPDYSTLAVSPVDALANLRRIADWNYQQALRRARQPIDHTDWWISPQTPGAVLLFQQNAYNFAAALLQAPKFDPAASDAANYGAIGAIVGHEVSHFVDTLGADYNASGGKFHWWTAADQANYEAAVAPLIQQFAGYRPLADLRVDGRKTLVENVADLAGLAAAFDAHRHALGAKANDREYVREQDRQFFIGFARSWRGKNSEDGLRTLLTSDGHAPETYRIATVRNLDAWYDAFDVKPGHRLYLEPKARVRVW
jgi:predicted metalloendopeptidase